MGNPLEKGQLKKSAIKDQAVIPKSTCHSESTQQRLASMVSLVDGEVGDACDASFWIFIYDRFSRVETLGSRGEF